MMGAPLGDLVPPPEASLQGAWGLDLTQEPGTRVTPCPVSAGPCAHCPWEPGARGRPSPSVRPTGRLVLPKGQPRVARALSIRARWVLAGPQLRATPHVPPGRGDAAAASRGPRAPRAAGTARGSSPGRRPQTGAGGGGAGGPGRAQLCAGVIGGFEAMSLDTVCCFECKCSRAPGRRAARGLLGHTASAPGAARARRDLICLRVKRGPLRDAQAREQTRVCRGNADGDLPAPGKLNISSHYDAARERGRAVMTALGCGGGGGGEGGRPRPGSSPTGSFVPFPAPGSRGRSGNGGQAGRERGGECHLRVSCP